MTLSTAAAFIALATTLTASLVKYAKGWLVKYVDWDDSSRAEGSCWGNNITDVFMKYFVNGNWLPMFVVGTENFNPTGVHVKLSKIQLILNDPATGGSRVGTALELVRDVGKFFENRGLARDTTLLAEDEDDPECFFKVQVAIVPCDEGKTVDTAIFANNYQARQTPRNAMFLCNGQGVSLQLDKPNFNGQSRYCLAEYNEKKGKWLEFATTTDVSKRTIEQCGTETKEEALQAIAEGKTAEVPIGPIGCKKSGSIMTIQVPIDQEAIKKPRPQAEQWHRSLAEGERREDERLAAWRAAEQAGAAAAAAHASAVEAAQAAAEAKAKGAAEARALIAEAPPAPKKQKPSPPSSPVSKRMAPKVKTRLAASKEQEPEPEPVVNQELPEWGSWGYGPIGTGDSAAAIGEATFAILSKSIPPVCGATAVKQEPAGMALDDEESELVSLSPDDHSRPAGAPLQNGFDGYVTSSSGNYTSLGACDDDCEPKFANCSAMCDDSEPAPAYRSLGSADPDPEPATTRGGGDMGMGGVGDALPELETKTCKMGRFFKGPFLGVLAALFGNNLVRDKAGGVITIVKTIIVTCPVGEEPSEHDIKQLIKLALEDLQCAVKCGGKANSLFSETSKALGQVTDAITPKAVQGIIETITAVTGSLPAGIF